MTDINKLIEKEAERHISQFNTFEYKEYDDLISWGYEGARVSNDANQLRDRAFMNGFKSGASFILHQNRWRKVEEELPETNVDVLLKFDNGNVSIGVYCKDEFEEYFSCINGDEYSISEVTEWKPIE